MGEDGAYNITSPSGNINEAIENIKFQIELVASNNHLWIQWAESGGEVPSGISLMVKDMERKEDYYDDIALWRLYEKEFYNIERIIAKYNGIEFPEEFGVDFQEVEYPKTVQDQIAKDQFDVENNLITRAKIMVRENKDLTIEQAQKLIDEHRKVNEKKTPSQSLLNSVKELDKINNVDFQFEGDLEEIIKHPIKWAETQVDQIINDNIDKYLESKALGERFWDEIRDQD